jgi:hypothetical protein
MTLCRVCGRAFDPSGFQVVVPGLGEGFDRVECAEIALARGIPPAPPPIPPPAGVKPIPAPTLVAAAAPVPAALARRPFLVGANVALLAAGAAAAVYLWLRVFAADPSSSLSLPESATPAQGRATVPSQIDGSPRGSSQPDRNGPAGASADSSGGEAGPTPSTEPPPILVSNPSPRSPSSNGGTGGGDPAGGGNGGGAGGGGGDPQGPEPPKPPSPPDTPGKCEDDVGCDDVDDEEDDDDTSAGSRDASARARDGDQSRDDDSGSRGGSSRHDDSDNGGGDKSKHESSDGDKTKDESKHENDHTRADESGHGKKKGDGTDH